MILNEINQNRKDAHSNIILESDFEQLRLYFNKLEKVLDNWV